LLIMNVSHDSRTVTVMCVREGVSGARGNGAQHDLLLLSCRCSAVRYSVLQCVVVRCSVLQCVAVCSSVLQGGTEDSSPSMPRQK